MCISPVGRRRGAPEDSLVGVGEEPLDGRWQGLDEAGLNVVGAWGLAVGLIRRGLQVSNGVLLHLGPRTLRYWGHVATKISLEAGEIQRALAIQLLPEGVDRSHHVRSVWVLGTLTFHRPEGPGASTSMAPLTAFLGVGARGVLDGGIAVGHKECAEVADVLFHGGRLPLLPLLQLAYRGRADRRQHVLERLHQQKCCL